MHSMDNYYVSKLIPLIAEAGVSAVANPLINITIQGRHDTYPKRRGMTRVPELMAAGVDVAFGHDCVLDPWYPLGSADMLEVAHMGLHVAQMTGQAAMRACFEAVTTTPARILGLEGYGLAPGCHADFVLLDARDPVEAIRLARGEARRRAPRAHRRAHAVVRRDARPSGPSDGDPIPDWRVGHERRRAAPRRELLRPPQCRAESMRLEVGRHPRSQTGPAGLGFALLARASLGGKARSAKGALMSLSVIVITKDEEAAIARTLRLGRVGGRDRRRRFGQHGPHRRDRAGSGARRSSRRRTGPVSARRRIARSISRPATGCSRSTPTSG